MVWWYASRQHEEPLGDDARETIRCSARSPTPSQRAIVKYFWVVSALILVQILLGVVTAHYGVEGNGFYGIPLASMPALQRDADLAPAARPVLDRDRVAGGRPVHRPAGQRHGAEVAAARRQRAVRRAAAGRRRLDGRAVAERQAACCPTTMWFYFGHQRLRVHRPRARLADRPARRPVPLAGPDGRAAFCRRSRSATSSGRC